MCTIRLLTARRRLQNHLFLLAGLFTVCLLTPRETVFAQASRTANSKLATAAELVGEWNAVDDSSNCTTESFTIQPLPPNDGHERFQGVEKRRCDRALWQLNYYGSLIQRDDWLLLAFNPPSSNDPFKIKAVVNLERGQKASTYASERLTLWVSGDGCELQGWRKNMHLSVSAFTIRKADCMPTTE